MSATKEHLTKFLDDLVAFINTNTAELGANHPAIVAAKFMLDSFDDFSRLQSNDLLVTSVYRRLNAAVYNMEAQSNA